MKPSLTSIRDEKILAFCVGGKTTFEIAEHMGFDRSTISNYMQRLQKDDRIIRIKPVEKRQYSRGGITYLYATPGSVITHEPIVQLPPGGIPEPIWNVDFIAVMHRVLHLP